MKNIQRMRSLVDISKIVTESDDFYKIKDIIINKMLSVVHPTKACVNLFFEDDYSYSHLVCSQTLKYIPVAFPKNEVHGTKIDFSIFPEYIHEAVKEKKIVVVKDVFSDPKAKGEENLALNEDYRGRAVFPFINGNRVVGFLSCYLTGDDELDQSDMDFISQVASLMALSISITEKNRGINSLINKLRNSIDNMNVATRQLTSTKDINQYLKMICEVVKSSSDSDYCLINLYDIDINGKIVGQKLSVVSPENATNMLNSLMPEVIKTKAFNRIVNGYDKVLPNGENLKNMMFIKFMVDTKTELIAVCGGSKRYLRDDLKTLSMVSKQVALSLKSYDNSVSYELFRNLENDLSILQSQQKLIMDGSSISINQSQEIFPYHRAAQFIGGDFYNAVVKDDKIIFIIADVMGHGVVANYIVAMIKGAFDILGKHIDEPSKILRHLNNNLYSELDKMGVYATAVVGCLDINSNILTMSNAGHYFPILVEGDKATQIKNKKRHLALGIMENSEYTDFEYEIKKDDQLCFFTDGIIEMKNINGEEFGMKNLIKFLMNTSDDNSEKLSHKLNALIDSYDIEQTKKDDILMVFIKNKN